MLTDKIKETTMNMTVSSLLVAASMTLLAGCETTQSGSSSGQSNDGYSDVAPPQSQGTDDGTVTPAGRTMDDSASRTVSGGFTIDHSDWKDLGYRWDWTGFSGFRGQEKINFINVYDDLIIVQGSRASMTVIDTRSGRNRWQDRLANPLTRFTGSTREGNRLFISAESELFIIDAESGNWLERQRLEEVVNTKPMLYNGQLIFGTSSGRILAHRTDYGLRAWKYEVGAPVVADPVLIGDVIGAISQSGRGLLVSAGSAIGLGHPTIGSGLATNPVTDGQQMYVAAIDQSVYAFPPEGDKHTWRYRTEDELTTQPTIHGGVLYVSVPSRGLVALNPITGSELWIGPEAHGEVVASRAGSLVVWDGTAIKAVDPTNGDLISSFEAPGLAMLRADTFVDGSLFGVTKAGAVIRFSPR